LGLSWGWGWGLRGYRWNREVGSSGIREGTGTTHGIDRICGGGIEIGVSDDSHEGVFIDDIATGGERFIWVGETGIGDSLRNSVTGDRGGGIHGRRGGGIGVREIG